MFGLSKKEIVSDKELELTSLLKSIKNYVDNRDDVLYMAYSDMQKEAGNAGVSVSEYAKSEKGRYYLSLPFLNKQYICHLMMLAYEKRIEILKLKGSESPYSVSDYEWYEKEMLPMFGDSLTKLIDEEAPAFIGYLSESGLESS
ncbi:hypothetical protein [Providencia heimbachae]|uniref:hypothetical protein n=1 Tax=Providencia heimbachae TaxID=333962 RepID=UPI0008380AAB|nr:hypothetical protein [Providencia heimbachae]NIH21860.1 hypothetical protein [Providencia heimbachae]